MAEYRQRSMIVIIFLLIFLSIPVRLYAAGLPSSEETVNHNNQRQQDNREIETIISVPEKWKKGLEKDLLETSQQYKPIKLGNRYSKEGKYDEAIAAYKSALVISDLDPAFESAANTGLINAYEKNGQYKEAAETLSKRLPLYKGRAKSHNMERVKYLEYAAQERFDLAIKHARKALEIVQDEPIYRKAYLERLHDLEAKALELSQK